MAVQDLLEGSSSGKPIGVREEIALRPPAPGHRHFVSADRAVSSANTESILQAGDGSDAGGHLLEGETLRNGQTLRRRPAPGEVPQNRRPGRE